MKKLLSTIMALVMLLSLVPMAVAEEAGTETSAVQSNDVYQVTEAAELIWAAEHHTGVVKLMNDVELNESLNIGSVDSEQKVLTLDLNGYNIFAPNCVITVRNAKLTVTGPGKIYETSPYFGAILIKGSKVAENKDYTVVNIGAEVELEGWSSIFVDQNGGYAYGVVVNVDSAKLTGVKDNTGDNGSAIYVNGSIKDPNNAPKLVLNNVTQVATGAGMYLAGYTDTTITGGSITGGDTGIEIRAGELTVNGATVEATAKEFSCVSNGNGTTTVGAGIAVAQHTTKLPIKVTINSGDISGYSALYQSNPEKNDDASVKEVSVAVNGGTFEAINGGTVSVYSENNCVAVTGGTFSSDPTEFLADKSLIAVPSKGGVYVVQPKEITVGDTTTKVDVSDDGKTVTVTETENKNEGNVATRTETVTVKDNEGNVTKVTETVTTEKTENGGKTTVVTKKDTLNKTETTEVTHVIAPTTASDVTLDVKNTTNVAVNKASMAALTGDTVKDVIIETKDAKLTLNKTAVETMENNVAADGKMTLNVTVTENTAKEVTVKVEAKTQGDKNVFPPETKNTNGEIEITIPYTGTADYLDLWYVTNTSTYMGRFPVVNGYVSFKVTHFSQYNLIPVASSGSSVIKTGAGSSAASTTQTVTTDLTPGSITKVTVDGKVVDAKYYTVSGSNVTFTAEFLKTLKNGSHTVTVENATKIAKGVFTVNNPTTAVQAPTTADAGIALYAGMAIASVMGTGVVFTSRKRKNH